MPTFAFPSGSTRSWRISLGDTASADPQAVEWLRSEFFKLRERAGLLIEEIHRDLPDFTRHDLSHCDALWEMADFIGGDQLKLNPAEGFVLGAVFLLHDAALSLAALPGRLQDLRNDPLWADTAVDVLRKNLGRQPRTDELEKVNDGRDRVTQQVAATVLRTRHADFAERLALQHYTSMDGESFYLIEDEALRTHFGRDIGRIAASHGRSLERVSHDFASQPSLPPVAGRCPASWNVNRLKLACLIRTCDAIHLDSRRAPGFLWAIRQPVAGSDPHWQFQRRISVACDGDRIRFSSGYAFPASEALAWWTGYELVQNADRELRQVDALLADIGEPRFAARSVFGADSPERLQVTVPTHGWEPVEARVRVSNVAELVSSLGGENLYGRHTRGATPLRELIQNACDAVRARRVLEPQVAYAVRDLGEVVVRQGRDEYGHWVEVEDNGLGMSTAVLTGPLLDFGSSLWRTQKLHEEWPGLSGRGFEATGRFGIGFFSVFMWGERVRVTSRRFDRGRDTTRVLEWQKGLDWHPLLRFASAQEHISDGGTRVRVWTTRFTESEEGSRDNSSHLWNLDSLCRTLCPALDVNLWVEQDAASTFDASPLTPSPTPARKHIVSANDWITCDGKELLRRVWSDYYNFDFLRSPELLESVAQMVRPLHRDGNVVGRACLFDWRLGSDLFNTANYRSGCVTVGGLRAAELAGLAGMLLGEPARAARDEATPIVEAEELARWATEQGSLFATFTSDFNRQVAAATVVRMCGGLTGPLFITATGHADGWLQLSHDDIVEMNDFPNEVLFLDFKNLDGARLAHSIRLHPNVFLTSFDHPSLLIRTEYMHFLNWNPGTLERVAQVGDPDWRNRYRTLFGALIEAVASRWRCSISDVLDASTLKNNAGDPPVEREIGFINDQPFTHQVGLLRRPQM